MYQIEQNEPSRNFKRAWQSAVRHLQAQGNGSVNWLRVDLNPPLAEHISFRIGNQLFFVFVEAEELRFNRWKDLFLKVSREATATPCVLPMAEHLTDFGPSISGWGLVHAETGNAVNPLEMLSDELIEMSDWELHDFAIQVVKDNLKKEGKNVFGAQSGLAINPSIWFEDSGQECWVVVKAVRYPEKEAEIPKVIQDMKTDYLYKAKTGYVASAWVANANDPFDPMASENGNFIPIYRGHKLTVGFKGLQEV